MAVYFSIVALKYKTLGLKDSELLKIKDTSYIKIINNGELSLIMHS